MMADYVCECGDIFTHHKPYELRNEPFPPQIKCKKCGEMARRKYSALPFSVNVGNCGNASNGYSSK